MAANETPKKKKIRLEEESVLNLFSSKHDLYHELKEAFAVLSEVPCALCLVKITNCDGNDGSSFSDIFCKTARNVDEKDNNCIYSFESVFEQGWKMLNSYIKNPSFKPQGEPKEALNKLMEFLLNRKDSEKCLIAESGINKSVENRSESGINKSGENTSETKWCQIVTHHYFSKLALYSDYIIDETRCSGKSSICSCGQASDGILGNTCIGHEKTWHGYVDILLGSPSRLLVPVVSAPKPIPPGGKNMVEVEDDTDDSCICREQMIGQCIVNSFLQMKRHPEYTNFLIPLIGVSNTNLIFFFYDAEHDILIESAPQRLFDKDNQFNVSTVLTTWLVLNYKFFCSGVTSVILENGYKCNFPAFAGDTYELYKNELKYNCFMSKNVRSKFFEPWTMGKFTFYRSEIGKLSFKS